MRCARRPAGATRTFIVKALRRLLRAPGGIGTIEKVLLSDPLRV